ncbi:MAG: hypothetical protein RID53_14945 [Coleofasciculus sp. B1-GNL1-01]|uniref:hypothetical protein n=1 Tax=Coleofasciculus sp. B1-GNL1-01 TaxID=3068484 RepID=UPI0032FEAC6D
MKKILLFSAEVILLCSTAVPAQATILNVSQGGQIITAPSSVSYNFPGYEHPNFMLGFSEKQNVKLSSNLAIDGGFIAAGQLVSSHMIFLNTPGSRRLALSNINWTFDSTILGVMSDGNGLLEAASNTLLGVPHTFYPGSFTQRGLEWSRQENYSEVGSNVLIVSMKTTTPGDWIRVVTQAKPIPEPTSTLGLLTISLVAKAVLKRTRKPSDLTSLPQNSPDMR